MPDSIASFIPQDVEPLIIKQLEARLANMPEEARKLRFISGDKIHTIEQMYAEMFNKSEYGIPLFKSYVALYTDFITRLGS